MSIETTQDGARRLTIEQYNDETRESLTSVRIAAAVLAEAVRRMLEGVDRYGSPVAYHIEDLRKRLSEYDEATGEHKALLESEIVRDDQIEMPF